MVKNKWFFLMVIIAEMQFCQAQCSFFTKGKTYQSTCFKTIHNVQDVLFLKSGIDISFVKTGSSGLVILKLDFPDDKIIRNVLLYLDDNSIITLVNRKQTWVVNNERFTQFSLTSGEINKLKNVNIQAIRFWKCYHYIMPECENAHHFENIEFKEKELLTSKYVTVERIDFPSLITELFE